MSKESTNIRLSFSRTDLEELKALSKIYNISFSRIVRIAVQYILNHQEIIAEQLIKIKQVDH
jgi:hypothetical protein